MRKVCVQLCTSADNVALPEFAATRLVLTAGCAANRSISFARWAHSNEPAAATCGSRMQGQTDGHLTIRQTHVHILCRQQQ